MDVIACSRYIIPDNVGLLATGGNEYCHSAISVAVSMVSFRKGLRGKSLFFLFLLHFRHLLFSSFRVICNLEPFPVLAGVVLLKSSGYFLLSFWCIKYLLCGLIEHQLTTNSIEFC